MIDREGRIIDYLRISVTDRCNMRCVYCMPPDDDLTMPQDAVMTYEDIVQIVKAGASNGIKKVRLTGGEPLMRRDILPILRAIKAVEGIEEVSITTNGLMLGSMLDQLVEHGLDRVNLSLDSLVEERFNAITRSHAYMNVMSALEKALALGLTVKINVVMIKGWNDDEMIHFARLTKDRALDVRFIELMPIGCGADYEGVNNQRILEVLKQAEPELEPVKRGDSSGPATYYRLPQSLGLIGLISPMSHGFCETCNRIRVTPEGFLKPCLHSSGGVDLKARLDRGGGLQELSELMRTTTLSKPKGHAFGDEDAEHDQRRMNQIGG